MLSKNLTLDDFGLLGLGNVGHSSRENCISIICSAVFGQEPDKAGKGSHVELCLQDGYDLNLVVIKQEWKEEELWD